MTNPTFNIKSDSYTQIRNIQTAILREIFDSNTLSDCKSEEINRELIGKDFQTIFGNKIITIETRDGVPATFITSTGKEINFLEKNSCYTYDFDWTESIHHKFQQYFNANVTTNGENFRYIISQDMITRSPLVYNDSISSETPVDKCNDISDWSAYSIYNTYAFKMIMGTVLVLLGIKWFKKAEGVDVGVGNDPDDPDNPIPPDHYSIGGTGDGDGNSNDSDDSDSEGSSNDSDDSDSDGSSGGGGGGGPNNGGGGNPIPVGWKWFLTSQGTRVLINEKGHRQKSDGYQQPPGGGSQVVSEKSDGDTSSSELEFDLLEPLTHDQDTSSASLGILGLIALSFTHSH